ncbi:MAG: hypothetical protein ACYTFU_09490 [Planctomycetota bacterium]
MKIADQLRAEVIGALTLLKTSSALKLALIKLSQIIAREPTQ